MMNIMTVAPAYAPAMARAAEKMQSLSAGIQSGAVVSLFTSEDPEIVAGLHEQARRDTAEMEAMNHSDHNHAP